jgi:hypothetical protein
MAKKIPGFLKKLSISRLPQISSDNWSLFEIRALKNLGLATPLDTLDQLLSVKTHSLGNNLEGFSAI